MNEKRYHHVDFPALDPVDCCCGTTRRAFADLDDAPASAHYLEAAEEPRAHYHKNTTEIYLILEGHGHLELDGEMVAVGPLSAVMIKPGCVHRIVGQMKLINIPVPKHDDDDFFYPDEA